MPVSHASSGRDRCPTGPLSTFRAGAHLCRVRGARPHGRRGCGLVGRRRVRSRGLLAGQLGLGGHEFAAEALARIAWVILSARAVAAATRASIVSASLNRLPRGGRFRAARGDVGLEPNIHHIRWLILDWFTACFAFFLSSSRPSRLTGIGLQFGEEPALVRVASHDVALENGRFGNRPNECGLAEKLRAVHPVDQ